MRKLMITLAISCAAANVFCQKESDAVPQIVKEAFAKTYPNIKKVKWDKEGNDFEASFHEGKAEQSVVYDVSGNVKEIETEIAVSALPEAVKKSISKDYPDFKVKEAAKIVSGNVTTYEAEGKQKGKTVELIFSEEGKLLKMKEGKD